MKRTLRLFPLLLSTCFATCQAAHPQTHHWAYEGENGPAAWGDLEKEYATCKLGHRQSPIDITHPKRSHHGPALSFEYKPTPLKIINNGHSVQVNYVRGSFLTVGDKRYELKQFHFHHPSEERVDGKGYDMVAHLVHADSEGHLGVVAVLLQSGAESAAMKQLWANLPATEGEEQAVEGVEVNAADLLPAELSYYTFQGSLTTPPCSEGVTWFVLKTPSEVSAEQVKTFATLYPNDARLVQPTHGRRVIERDVRSAPVAKSE